MNTPRVQTHVTTFGLIICLLLFPSLCGCGSKSDEPTVVTPPSPTTDSTPDASTTTADPPGGLELPTEDIPGETPSTEPGSGGLELPDGPIKSEASDDTAKVQYATWDEIEKVATSTGRVTVVDIWSTVCAPCVKEFPGLVKLDNEHGDVIQCISVDVDYDGRKSRPPETYEKAVIGFLTSVGAKFPNYISRTPSDDVFAALDVVSIPAVLIFDANGKLVKRFIDADETAGFTYEKDVVPLVTKLAG